jgi:uncharacterized protein YbbK (DUF523 family)
MLGISSCLGGICCRYDGKAQELTGVKQLVEQGDALLICPEVLGELPIPRPPAEIVGGDGFAVWAGKARVLTNNGIDVTNAFKEGARLAYLKLKEQAIQELILKEKSPSCGAKFIYDGQFSGVKKAGVGVATAYFISKGLVIYSDTEWETIKERWL